MWWRPARARCRRRGTPAERASAGPFVYRLGRYPFKVERRVRFPLGLCRDTQVQGVVGAVAQFG